MLRSEVKRAPVVGWMVGGAVAIMAIVLWTAAERRTASAGVTLFSATVPGIAVVLPANPIAPEREAAELVRSVLGAASGRPATDFPLVIEGASVPARGIYLGATRRAAGFMRAAAVPPAPFDTGVGVRVSDGAVVLASERRTSIVSAASWWLEKHAGAHWFMPGPLGASISARRELVVSAGVERVRPGFLSRNLSGFGNPEARTWFARNRLEDRIEHSHALAEIFKPDDFRRAPEMAPLRRGERYLPKDGYNWQPDFTSRAAVEHAATAANRAFAADPARVSFSLSENDSLRFDESPATHAAVAPPRFFRRRPDYSDLVFGFANAVADRVRRVHPDRWLPSYAYYWTENTPRFPVARNVVPFLTADRAQWFEPEFVAEDRQLIERWTRSGAGLVGVYDYFYGAPFLVPRPTLYAVQQSIPFEYQAGVRAFYAEMNPNWALDGPKPWLVAQLLWSPEADPTALLETYYREFWREVAEPMRAFFAVCERVWLNQPRPGYWIKYYRDEHQALLFPAAVRAELRSHLAAATDLARDPLVRARVDFAAAGFGVSEAFAEFCAARERLRVAVETPGDVARDLDLWRAFAAARAALTREVVRVPQAQPLALAPIEIEGYVRNDPTSRVVWRLADTVAGRTALEADGAPLLAALGIEARELLALKDRGVEGLVDPSWQAVRKRPIGGAADFEWLEPGQIWQGSGEPFEGRQVEWLPAAATNAQESLPDGGGAGALSSAVRSPISEPRPVPSNTPAVSPSVGAPPPSVLRFARGREESLGQWVPAHGGAVYAARIDVRARVSPGNATFLVVSFLDEKHQYVGSSPIDRLPAVDGVQHATLCLIAKAPPTAKYVGFGVRATNQVNEDFAEFSRASLRVADR